MAAAPTILGLHVTGDQSAAALIRGGEVVAAVAEERLTRQKRTRAFPQRAIAYCLAEAGLDDLAQVDHVVTAWNPELHMRAINMSGFTAWRRYDPEWLYIVPNNLIDLMPARGSTAGFMTQGIGGRESQLIYLNHHHAHLGWAYASPFDEAAVAIVDEYGEQSSLTFARLQGNYMSPVGECRFPDSLGIYYATFTAFLGFQPNSDEWKVMGAAAHGDPDAFAHKIRALVRWRDGQLALDQHCLEFANTRFGGYFTSRLADHLGITPRGADAPLEQCHFDLAASAQAVFEETLFEILGWLHQRTGSRNLVLNGGCAMNSLANGKILARTPFERLYVSQAPADNGCSIGGALWLHGQRYAGGETWRATVPAATGPGFSADEIDAVLQRCRIGYRRTKDLAGETAAEIAKGRIVGWFQGRMEFGERALGCRSILADPRDAAAKDRVNATVKYRESYRPFAPSVTAERAAEFFDLPAGATANYMEQVYPVKAGQRNRIPAVVHADGTGRLQTVAQGDNPLFHELLCAFDQAAGVPVLLNTSFNVNGEPIVCTPEDALRTFVSSGLDLLVLGPFMVAK